MDTAEIDRIIATERRNHRWRAIASLVGLVVLFGGIAISRLAIDGAALPAFFVSHPAFAAIAGWVIAALLMVIVFPLTRTPAGAHDPAVMQRQIETYQSRYRSWLVLLGAFTALFALLETVFPNALPGYFAPPLYGFNWFGSVYALAVLHAILSSRRRPVLEIPEGIDFNDELVRAMRLKAARTGLIAVMIGVAASYVWILYHPLDATKILPWILAAGVLVPAISFAVLHWRAGREG
jgi:4-amino-4-deoxy-L-arabinose transferase-like glycosyltransferase